MCMVRTPTAKLELTHHADLSNKSDVGNVEGTSWSLSSAKPKHGVAQLMDENLDTLWQYVHARMHGERACTVSRAGVAHTWTGATELSRTL